MSNSKYYLKSLIKNEMKETDFYADKRLYDLYEKTDRKK